MECFVSYGYLVSLLLDLDATRFRLASLHSSASPTILDAGFSRCKVVMGAVFLLSHVCLEALDFLISNDDVRQLDSLYMME